MKTFKVSCGTVTNTVQALTVGQACDKALGFRHANSLQQVSETEWTAKFRKTGLKVTIVEVVA